MLVIYHTRGSSKKIVLEIPTVRALKGRLLMNYMANRTHFIASKRLWKSSFKGLWKLGVYLWLGEHGS